MPSCNVLTVARDLKDNNAKYDNCVFEIHV